MRITVKIITLAVLSLCLCAAAYSALVYLKEFTFNEDSALDKWQRMVLNGKVDYEQIKYGNNGYIQALSDKTCSALYYRIGFKLKDYPILSWRWRVLKFPETPDAKTETEKNDYAARVYVIFPFLTFSSSKFIEYVWAENIPAGTIMDNPKGSNVKMVVVRSGSSSGEQWMDETRNVYEDYVKAFGAGPVRNAGAIAIMCNSDGTGTSAESLFDDIIIANGAMPERRVEQK